MCCRKTRNTYRHQISRDMSRSLFSTAIPRAQVNKSDVHMDVTAKTLSRYTNKYTMGYPPQYIDQIYADDSDPIYAAGVKDLPPADIPPTYEKATSTAAPEAVTRPIPKRSSSGFEDSQAAHLLQLPAQYKNSPNISELLKIFSSTLLAYQSGTVRRRQVRKALKTLRDELYENEVARRSAIHGRLSCGEKCQIWSDIQDIDFGY